MEYIKRYGEDETTIIPGTDKHFNYETLKEMLESYPCELMERVVWGMLPKGPLGRKIAKKLFVYKGENHNHEAQKPEVLEWKR